MKEIMNIDEVAKYLRMHPHTVYKLCHEGQIPHSKMGKQYKFKKSAIDEMLVSNGWSTNTKTVTGTSTDWKEANLRTDTQ